MHKGLPPLASLVTALGLILVIALLGFSGGSVLYGELLGHTAGFLSGLTGTSVTFDGDLLIIIQDPDSLAQRPLEIHPNFSYSAIPLLFGLVVATPRFPVRKRALFGLATLGAIFVTQAFILTGFSFIDTTTDAFYDASRATYSAFWSMGPLLVAAWWFWSYWRSS